MRTRQGRDSGDVRANSVHTPEGICLASYTDFLHEVSGNPAISSRTMDGRAPPIARPGWWIFVIGIVLVMLLPFGLRAARRGT